MTRNTKRKSTSVKKKSVKKKSFEHKLLFKNGYHEWLHIAKFKYANYSKLNKFYKSILKKKPQFIYYDQFVGDRLQDLMTFVGNSISCDKLLDFFPNPSDLDPNYQYIYGKYSSRNLKDNQYPVIIFKASRDGSGHFNTKMPNEKNFDPYDEYQIEGTHQFCQTFSLMKLTGHLPQKINSTNNSFEKYYHYSQCALAFIRDMIISGKDNNIPVIYYDNDEKFFDYDELLFSIDYFLKYPALAVNIIEHLQLR